MDTQNPKGANDGPVPMRGPESAHGLISAPMPAPVREGVPVAAKVSRTSTVLIVVAAFLFATAIAAFAGAIVESREAAKREARVFAGTAATAFHEGACDRALRLAVAGLPGEGALPFAVQSRPLQDDLSFFGSAHDCSFRLALAGHTGLVSSAVFSPDGASVVTSSWDGTARVWNAHTGAVTATLSGHKFWVNSAAFSPDGGRIVTASWDKTARVWDAKTGAVLATLAGHSDRVNGAAFSADGTRVITAGNDHTARLWNAATGEALVTLTGHADAVTSAVLSPDGSRVVTASFDTTARIWSAETGAELAMLGGHGGWVWSAQFSADGSRIVTASEDKNARVWDTA